MIIQKERIISIDRYLRFLNETNSFYVCVKKCDDFVKLLKSKNICSALETGKRFVPNVVGASTFYNLHGKKLSKRIVPKKQELLNMITTLLTGMGRIIMVLAFKQESVIHLRFYCRHVSIWFLTRM